MTIEQKLKSLQQRELVVFDFDETLVDCNSDTWIHQLAPGQKIPSNLNYRPGEDYFRHVQSVLKYLYECGVREQNYETCLKEMPGVESMFDILVSTLAKQPEKYDMIIISDSNSYFIGSYLKSHDFQTAIPTILTNPAKFTDDGELLIEEHHIQDHCSLSSRNLCKGEALKNYIGKRMLDHKIVYTCINYVGDGENDLCPSAKLGPRDRIFARRNYTLDRLCTKLINNQPLNDHNDGRQPPEIKAKLVPWQTGQDILDTIQEAGTSDV